MEVDAIVGMQVETLHIHNRVQFIIYTYYLY